MVVKGVYMPHLLDEDFVQDLLSGKLCALREYVITDPSLDLQIRDNYINTILLIYRFITDN